MQLGLLRKKLLCLSVLALGPGVGSLARAAEGQGALAEVQEVIDADKYIHYATLARDWLIANGISLVVALVTLLIGRWLAGVVSRVAQKAMIKGKCDVTLAGFLGKLIFYALFAAVVIAAADQIGIKTTSFLAILGAAGLAVGLALKDSLANFASGVMIILFRPFKVGDAITAGGVTGGVEQIDIFSTIILTPDNQKIVVPNSAITSGVIININANPTRRIDLAVSIGYEDDLLRMKTVLEDLMRADTRILATPPPEVAVTDLGPSRVQLAVRSWVKTGDYLVVRKDLLEGIKLAFDAHKVAPPPPPVVIQA